MVVTILPLQYHQVLRIMKGHFFAILEPDAPHLLAYAMVLVVVSQVLHHQDAQSIHNVPKHVRAFVMKMNLAVVSAVC
jgi:acetaldehyde dehydrogenase (acetylating)